MECSSTQSSLNQVTHDALLLSNHFIDLFCACNTIFTVKNEVAKYVHISHSAVKRLLEYALKNSGYEENVSQGISWKQDICIIQVDSSQNNHSVN